MTRPLTISLDDLADDMTFRRLSDDECEQLAHDIRTGLRAIGIYNDLLQREITNQSVEHLQACSDGINDTVEDLTRRLEQLRER